MELLFARSRDAAIFLDPRSYQNLGSQPREHDDDREKRAGPNLNDCFTPYVNVSNENLVTEP